MTWWGVPCPNIMSQKSARHILLCLQSLWPTLNSPGDSDLTLFRAHRPQVFSTQHAHGSPSLLENPQEKTLLGEGRR